MKHLYHFNRIKDHNSVTCNAMISGCMLVMGLQAVNPSGNMKEYGLNPDVITSIEVLSLTTVDTPD